MSFDKLKGRTYASVCFYRVAWRLAGPDRAKLKAALPTVERSRLIGSKRKKRKEKKVTFKTRWIPRVRLSLCPLVVGFIRDSLLTASCLCCSLRRELSHLTTAKMSPLSLGVKNAERKKKKCKHAAAHSSDPNLSTNTQSHSAQGKLFLTRNNAGGLCVYGVFHYRTKCLTS